jgi:hypothetical protein
MFFPSYSISLGKLEGPSAEANLGYTASANLPCYLLASEFYTYYSGSLVFPVRNTSQGVGFLPSKFGTPLV